MAHDLLSSPHRRWNALNGDWLLVSPHRTQRPWQGKLESAAPEARPPYDPRCYLCPGNRRSGGARNPAYADVFVFENDFAALTPAETAPPPATGLLRGEAVSGICRVVCFSPRHDWTMPRMPRPAIRRVIDLWAEQVEALGRTYRWVQIFENKGELMGCSNPHPHGQIWASDFLPNEPAKEDHRQLEHWKAMAAPLLVDYLAEEVKRGERIVAENQHWVALVPYWATWPFELLLLPRRHVGERDDLASILKRMLTRYDNLFATSFPYSMGWHGAPTGDHPHWQLHAHFFPPLLRSATIKKYMVGYEMLAEPQRDLLPEDAARMLRDQPEVLASP
jgi:UDPglucose--hexose-1-phosphate uridylyltransferase